MPGFTDLAWIVILMITGAVLGAAILAVFIFAGYGAEVDTYGMLIAYPLMFIPPMLYASAKSRRNEGFEDGYALDNNNFGRYKWYTMVFAAVIMTLSIAFMLDPINMILPEMSDKLVRQLELLMNGPAWVALLSVSVFAPFFEEWLCRGIVLRGLLKNVRPAWAIIISALFFAAIHMNIWQGIPAFIIGLVFGYIYYKTGSLKLTMLMHCVNNTFSLLLSKIPGLEDIESFMDILSPWAYAGIYVACVLMLASAVILITGIPVKDTKMGGCDEVDALSID
jgi:membrane protease YdiL (CAAX protease family)